jgi:hypothetical protein
MTEAAPRNGTAAAHATAPANTTATGANVTTATRALPGAVAPAANATGAP